MAYQHDIVCCEPHFAGGAMLCDRHVETPVKAR